MGKRTVTTIEMHEVVTVRRPVGAIFHWCPACSKEVELVPLEEAAQWAGTSLRDVCRRIAVNDIHVVETANGALICLNWIPNNVSSESGGRNA